MTPLLAKTLVEIAHDILNPKCVNATSLDDLCENCHTEAMNYYAELDRQMEEMR